MPGLEHKVAVVTGAAQGMGRAHVERLRADGASVVAVDLNRERLDALESELPDVRCTVGDVSVAADAERVRDFATETFGGVDILVNNAGGSFFPASSLLDLQESQWDRIHSVNLKGQWLMARALVPLMRVRGGGRIVNIASTSALTGDTTVGGYAAAKAGVLGLTRALAAECGEYGITVNAIAPGLIRVREPKASLPPEVFALAEAQWLAKQKIKRTGEVWDVSAAAAFLVSDGAAFVTGQLLIVDGGSVFGS